VVLLSIMGVLLLCILMLGHGCCALTSLLVFRTVLIVVTLHYLVPPLRAKTVKSPSLLNTSKVFYKLYVMYAESQIAVK
jgi:hypothetical protein